MAVSNNRGFLRTLSKIAPHAIPKSMPIKYGGTISKLLSYNFRHENSIFNSEQPNKDMEFNL